MKYLSCAAALGLGVVRTTSISGCGSAGSKPSSQTAQVKIVLDVHPVGRYTPHSLVIHRGDRVVFHNVSNTPHTVSADAGTFDSGTIFAGKSRTLTAKKVGAYTYFCRFHAGMHGTIVVKP